MKIERETMNRILSLARLSMEEAELAALAQDMAYLVKMADGLKALELDGVEPTTHVLERYNILRDDRRKLSYDREKLLVNAPQRDESCFIVPKVVE